jgi:hypothetical protein
LPFLLLPIVLAAVALSLGPAALLPQVAPVWGLLTQPPCIQQLFPGNAFLVDCSGPSVAAGVNPPFTLANASARFLLAAVRAMLEVVRARFAAVSCWRTVASLLAASARCP